MHKNNASKGLRASTPKKQKKVSKTPKSKKLSTKARKTHSPVLQSVVAKPLQKPLFKVQKRFGGMAVDNHNRLLPVDYQHAHLHDPYLYFVPKTSQVFDEHPGREFIKLHYNSTAQYNEHCREEAEMIDSQVEGLYKSLTCPKEIEAFENVLIPIMHPYDEDHKVTFEEAVQEAEELGMDIDRIQNDKFNEETWTEFFTNDLKYESPAVAIRSTAVHLVQWGSAAYLAFIGFDSITQYYYDLQYPLHHDH